MSVKLRDLQFLAGLVHDDGPQGVEQLARVEPIAFLAADGGDDIVEIVEHDILLRCAFGLGVGASRLAHRLRHGVADRIEKRSEVRLLAVRRDRHVGRRDVQPDVEVLVLRRFGDGVREPASEHVDLPLVASRMDVAGNRRAVDAGDEPHVSALSAAQASTTKGIRRLRFDAERRFSARRGIGPVGKQFRTDSAEPLRLDRACILPRDLQQRVGLCAADVGAGHAGQPGFGNDLASAPAGAAIEVRDQFAHRHVAARRQQFVELRGVVPPRRRLAGVGLPFAPSRSRRSPSRARPRPLGIAGPKPISMRVPTGNSTGFALTTVVVPSRSGRSSIRRLRV